MSTAYHIYKNFIKNDFKRIGVGCYSSVFESKQDPNLVYKLGASIFDPCLTYLQLNIKNVHAPKVHKLYIGDSYYIAQMEYLYPLSYTKYNFKDTIINLVDKAMSSPLTEVDDLHRIANTIASIAIANDDFKLDLHNGNIMLRNNLTPVIIDPFCDVDIHYEDNTFEEWCERQSGKSM